MKKLVFMVLMLLLMLFNTALGEAVSAFTPIPWDVEVSPNNPIAEAYLPNDAGYHDDSLDITISMDRAYDTNIMIMRVKLADASQLRTAMGGKYPSKNATQVRFMTKKANAVAGVSADWFSYHNEGIVIRNGVTYREKPNQGRDTLIIDKNGDFTILAHTTKEAWEAIDKENVAHTFTYGPALVVNGEQLTDMSSVKLSCGKNKQTQRTFIGQSGPLEYVIVATEGPENTNSKGLTISQAAEYAVHLGLDNAYNLDGGSSSTIVLNNRKINSLSSHKERTVGDCIWFATLVPIID